MENNKKYRILVIEDEDHIAQGLKLNLSLKGYVVTIAADGVAGLEKWKELRPDLIVLDIMLPGIDGLSVLRSIRLEDEKIPILILSAKGASDDKVKGLTYGVDDYIAKPFDLEEFLLRVERLLTRVSWNRTENDQRHTIPTGIYRFGPNRIDFETSTAYGRSGPVKLTEQEARLLKLFIANSGKPLSRKAL